MDRASHRPSLSDRGQGDALAAAARTPRLPDAAALLDALPGHAALLDGDGHIVAVNSAWRDFAAANGLRHADGGVGLDYLGVCDAARGADADASRQAAQGLRDVLDGRQPSFTLDYGCHAPDEQRWFRLTATRLAEGGALVLHASITDHELARRDARDGESRYRSIFDGNALPAWLYDPQTLRFLAVNDTAVRVYGYSRDEFLAMTVLDIRPADDVPAMQRLLDELAHAPETESVGLWRHRLKDGRLRQVEVHARQISWNGRPARLVMTQDITERLAAEQALRESDQRLRQITGAITEVFWLSEGDRLLYVSPAYESIWGRSCDSLLQDPRQWLAAVHPDDRERVALALLLRESGGYDVEYRIVRPDGALRWIADRAFRVASEGAVRIAGVARDITAQRQSQERLQLLESAVARINDIVIITAAEPVDGDGPRIVFVNDAFERLTGWRRDEVIGRSPRLLQGPQTDRRELDRIRAALQRWEPVRAEIINYTKAGVPFWLDLEIVPIADERGWFTHWVAIERDITERKQVEQQLRQSQRLESLGQLTGGVAHDFNNLLTVMLGNAELLGEQLPAGSLQQQLAQMIGGAAQRGAELTQRLLAFARRQALEPRAVDLARLVGGLDGLLRRSLGEHIEIEHRSDRTLWPTLVDPTQLENALLNLAINARDAMPGGGRLTIELRNTQLDAADAARPADVAAGDYVLLAVTDNGSGIPAALQPHVFEPFVTTKERGKGTGLGLSMVYGFVKQSRGHVTIQSEAGQGTTVRLYLPRHSRDEAPEPPPARAEPPAGRGERVLLVEDDPHVRGFALRQLESLGYAVLAAADGPAALTLLQEHADIALLFTDVVMPGGMNGRELADAARTLRPQLPVLFTSGYSENALLHDGRLDDGVLLLGKPYRRAELALKLHEALARAPATGRAH